MKLRLFLSVLALLLPGLVLAEPHQAVQAALDYQLRENTCAKPKIILQDKSITAPAQESSGVSFFEGTSTADVSDIDVYTRERAQRKEKRWRKCVAVYKEDLLGDMERLKGSAQHGLTQEQSKTILGHMAHIQKVYMSPEGAL